MSIHLRLVTMSLRYLGGCNVGVDLLVGAGCTVLQDFYKTYRVRSAEFTNPLSVQKIVLETARIKPK